MASTYSLLKETLKDEHLNDILDKIKMGIGLSESEIKFVEQYEQMLESDLQDHFYLSKNQVFDKICKYLERGKNVICDLYDKDGKINDQIESINNLFEEDCCVLLLKHGEAVKIYDKFLYKITYNIKKDHYCLEAQSEYFEKITNTNED